MTQLRISYDHGRYQVVQSLDGRTEQPIGPRCDTPAEAAYFYDLYAKRLVVSPLRGAADGSLSAPPSSGHTLDLGLGVE